MSNTVLIVDGDVVARTRVAAVLAAGGFSVVEAADARTALTALHGVTHRPAAIVLDPTTFPDATLLFAAQATDARLRGVPVVVVGAHRADVALPEHVQVLMPRRAPDLELLAMLRRLAPGDLATLDAPRAVGRGTGPVGAAALEAQLDLHAYAEAKLVQYLGEARGLATLRDVLRELGLARIDSTATLHQVAQTVRSRGPVEASVSVLLSGRATLIDSDRTLKRS